MINNIMNNETTQTTSNQSTKPNENSGVHVQGHIKIFDPQTNEVFVKGRA